MRKLLERWPAVVIVSFVLGLSAIAKADVVVSDTDPGPGVSATPLVLGNLCIGQGTTKPVSIVISRQSSPQENFKDGTAQVVTVSNPKTTTGSGTLQATMAKSGTSVPPGWSALPDGSVSADSATVNVNLANIGSGPYVGTIDVTVTGLLVNPAGNSPTPGRLSGRIDVQATGVVCDFVAPTLTLPGSITREATSAAGAVVTYSATAVDQNPLSPEVSCVPASGATFAIGTTNVRCSASDAKGNVANGTFSVTVVDSTAPSIGDVTNIEADAVDFTGARVTFDSPGATDVVDGPLSTVCTPPSGDIFPLGTTTVTCDARDLTGNASSKSFTVTISDKTAPTIVVPADLTEEATGPDGAPVDFAVSATDNVDGEIAFECNPPSGSVFALGVQSVDCGTADSSGNAASAQFSVTVVDTKAPVFDVLADPVVEATSPAGAEVAYGAVVAHDLVDGNVTALCEPAPGTFAVGDTGVSCIASDSAGNSAEASFTVHVVDTTPPDISVSGDQTIEATGPDGAQAQAFGGTATDLVDGDLPVTCDQPLDQTFPIGKTEIVCSATDAAGKTAQASIFITVQDTTAPVLDLPEGHTAEATGPDGAPVFFNVFADDIVDGELEVTCLGWTSGDTFPLGVTTVACGAVDAHNNVSNGEFTVTVQDTTGPAITITPISPNPLEATSPDGAPVRYTASAVDLVDGPVDVVCEPADGSTLALGETTVTCQAIDAHGTSAQREFTVNVVDTTAPALTVPATMTLEATSALGAEVLYLATAIDAVDPSPSVTCEPPSGQTFPIGTTTVSCTASDALGHTSAPATFDVVVRDSTPPTIAVPEEGMSAEATSADGARVNYLVRARDTVDDAVAVVCIEPSGSLFPIGTTIVECTATDDAGNEGFASFLVTVVDSTDPVLTVPADMTLAPTTALGATATYTATATDLVDGPLSPTCTPTSGSQFPFGATLVNCSVIDSHGNSASASFTVTVSSLRTQGFFQPVKNNRTINRVRAGSTVPLKFRVSAGSTEVTSTALIASFSVTQIPCPSGDSETLEGTSTGGTSLRYDTSGGQFIQNWQTPRQSGCYRATIRTVGPSNANNTLTALFRLV